MRCGWHSEFEGLPIACRKTLPYSAIRERRGARTYGIRYGILIKQSGGIHSDWDGTPLDAEGCRHVVCEPCDLVWRDRGPAAETVRV